MSDLTIEQLAMLTDATIDRMKDMARDTGECCGTCRWWIDGFCQCKKNTWMQTKSWQHCENWRRKDDSF